MYISIYFLMAIIVAVVCLLLDPAVIHNFGSKPHKKHNSEKSPEKLPSNFSLIRNYIKKIYNNEFEVCSQDWTSSHGYWEFYKIPINNTRYIQLQLAYIYFLSTVSDSNKLVTENLLEEMNICLVTENIDNIQELFSIKFLTENSVESTIHHIRKPYKFIQYMEKHRKKVEEEIKLKAEKEAEEERKEQEKKIKEILSGIE